MGQLVQPYPEFRLNNDTLALSEQQLTLLLQGFDILGHQPVHYQTTL
ncbi:hypothetical protein [Aliivibrio salmonicida]|nr:hypothetical protein [Aliivibrio salmonicida]